MKRKDFLKRAALGTAGLAISGKAMASKASEKPSTYDELMKQVGFNHLPNTELVTAKSVLHKASTRGHANHGWLDSHHTFSFANYRNPERMHFGVLRVLNDDVVSGGKGFGTHPHDNMEIVSIPLEGDLEHQDSMGNKTIIQQGDVQVMSAGTGVRHSEYNANPDKPVKFLQIWMFPNKKNVPPRYDQIKLETKPNQLTQILSPSETDEGVWVHQNAWWHVGQLEANKTVEYKLRDPQNNGVYAFVLKGKLSVNGQELEPRDGYGLWDLDQLQLKGTSESKVLLMEVPMQLG